MKVKIYTTPTCPYCVKTKEFFKEHKVKYTEVDILKDVKAREDMLKKSGQMGVPVTEINGDIIVGFNEGAFRKLLKIK